MKDKLIDREDGLRLRCLVCGSTNIYALKDGTLVCRRCGSRTKNNKVIYKPNWY